MRRREKKFHYIYRTTNLLSGKYYIGMHSTNDLEDGYMGSGKRLRRSLNKYGKDNHIVEIMEFLNTDEELSDRELEVVNLNEIAKVNCMNLVVGGQGGFISLSGTKKGRKVTDVILEDKYGENFRSIITENFHNSMTIDERLNHSNKIKKSLRNYYLTNDGSFKGKTHTDETKRKIGKTNSILQKGKSNSQYGTCWICNEELKEIKKVKKEDLDGFLNLGWKRGRKLNSK